MGKLSGPTKYRSNHKFVNRFLKTRGYKKYEKDELGDGFDTSLSDSASQSNAKVYEDALNDEINYPYNKIDSILEEQAYKLLPTFYSDRYNENKLSIESTNKRT